MSKLRVDGDALAALADADGVIDADALRSIAVTRLVQARLLGAGLLHQLAPTLFAVAPVSWRSRVGAALRLGGPRAATYGPTSLALHGVGDESLPVHVVLPPAVRVRDRDWVRFHRSDLDRLVLVNHAPRRVGLDDSVVDAVGMLDELAAVALITRVVQERRTTALRLLQVAQRRPRLPHRRIVLLVLRDGAGIESALEWVYADRVERPHGIAPMRRQFVVPETGHRADGAFVDRRWLIHLDGAAYHDADADRRLDVRHAALGYSSSRLTWSDCWGTPCATARLLAGGEPPRRCRRCPPAPGRTVL
ncbi:hypothetical protein [Cumulibacter manganitolerans]|uniref:hypothetical protein n=1 Tax=Cumulibacter manganitolerans TaxID=1884992 RepID=UPI001296A36A|nr:hypothetical protein [Cumulibacter manganitolerans]